MPIQLGTILTAPTISAAGGTPSTMSSDGQTVQNGIHVADMAVADLRVRPHMTFKNYPPTLDPVTRKYGKGKRVATLTFPRTMADGLPGFPLMRLQMEDFPELTDAEQTKMLDWAAQCFFDADFRPFWKTGSVA